jgi:uncharacterized protein
VFVTFLSGWMIMAAMSGFGGERRPVKTEDIYQGSLLFMAAVAFIAGFIIIRRIPLGEMLGIHQVKILKGAGLAILFMAAAYPLVGIAAMIAQQIFGTEAPKQEAVQFFIDAAKKSETGPMAQMVFFGVLLAPLAEEFIFRGYLYGVTKRYCGFAAALIFNAALFAAVHTHAASFLPLFALALCLTIAYEATGSILIPMAMHALFNFITFLLLLFAAQSLPS